MCPRHFLLEVENTDNLVGIIGFQFLGWNFLMCRQVSTSLSEVRHGTNLGIQIRWVWDISDHFRMRIFFLCFAVLADLKHADSACASGAEGNVFSQVLRDIADWTGLWE